MLLLLLKYFLKCNIEVLRNLQLPFSEELNYSRGVQQYSGRRKQQAENKAVES